MIEVKLKDAGKRYQFEWIFKNLDFTFPSSSKVAITGGNGSGKSTLIQCISGQIPLTEGKLAFLYHGKSINENDIFKYLTISAPYMELPEEFTLKEFLNFHFFFKKPLNGKSMDEISEIMYLEKSRNKQILNFSSGMKQRLKLGISLLSEAPLVLLDEPTSNLDENGKIWYMDLIQKFGKDKTILVGSNDKPEYSFCKLNISLEDYKNKSLL